MSLVIFLFKIAVPPVLVAVMSLAARRWGATFGGLIMGLPWMTGPVLFFLALDKGEDFAVAAATGVELGVFSIVAYMFAYAAMSSIAAWPLSLAAAITAFIGTALVMQYAAIGLAGATAAALGCLLLAYVLLPRPHSAPVPVALPWWDIPARMAVTFGLVAIVMTLADVLGGQLSGIFATFPVILTVIGTFTHHQSGRDAVRRVLRGLSLSLMSFAVFFFVVGSTLPHVGLAGAYTLAVATAMLMSAGLIASARRFS